MTFFELSLKQNFNGNDIGQSFIYLIQCTLGENFDNRGRTFCIMALGFFFLFSASSHLLCFYCNTQFNRLKERHRHINTGIQMETFGFSIL